MHPLFRPIIYVICAKNASHAICAEMPVPPDAEMIVEGEMPIDKLVDGDIDPYNEQDVMYAVATRTQANEDLDIIKNSKANTLDPSQTDDIMTAKMIIDATKPMRRPWATRLDVPAEVRARFPIDKYFK